MLVVYHKKKKFLTLNLQFLKNHFGITDLYFSNISSEMNILWLIISKSPKEGITFRNHINV